MRFVVGDAAAARAFGQAGGQLAARVVLCWVDASGRWPTRGFFGAVSRQLGDAPRAAYEAAHAQGDLAEGDVHLVDCTAAAAGMHLVILVVLRRDKKAPYGTPLSSVAKRPLSSARVRCARLLRARLAAHGSCRLLPGEMPGHKARGRCLECSSQQPS